MYEYKIEKKNIDPEKFIDVRDKVLALFKGNTKVITMSQALEHTPTGSNWTAMAYVDRMVERGDLIEIETSKNVVAQYRVFMRHG